MGNEIYEQILTFLEEGRQNMQEYQVQDKSIVLFLGPSGVGKSTCINYVKGCEMIEKTDEETGISYIEAKDAVMEIGNGVYSQTLCPQICDMGNSEHSLCDCPGFFDNRGTQYMIAGAVLLREVVAQAKKIKGFVIVLDYASLLDSRYTLLSEVAQNLTEIFGNNQEKKENFLFLINKIPHQVETTVTDAYIYGLLQVIRHKIQTIKESSEQLKKVLYLIETMCDLDRTTVCKPLDKNCQRIQDKIENLQGSWTNEIGFGLSNVCKIEIQNVIQQNKLWFEEQMMCFKDSLIEDMREKIKFAQTVEEGGLYREKWNRILKKLEETVSFKEMKEFLRTISDGDGELKQVLIKQITIIEELKVYYAEESFDNVDPTVKETFVSALKVEVDVLNKTIAYLEELKQEKTRLEDAAYRIQRIRENTYIKREPAEPDLDEKEYTNAIYVFVPVSFAKMTDIKKVLLEYKLNTIQTIFVYGIFTLIIDTNLEKEHFSGRNIIFMGQRLEIPKGTFFVDVSGKDGPQWSEQTRLKDTLNGRDGVAATASGDILVSFGEVEKEGTWKLVANGGNGGNGESGQNGEKGTNGKSGADASIKDKEHQRRTEKFYEEKSGIYTYRYFLIEAAKGERGNNGKDGGNGGNAGAASEAGHVYLYGTANRLSVDVETKPGEHGKPGNGGNAGGKGSGGKGGKRGIKVIKSHMVAGPHGSCYEKTEMTCYYPDGYETEEEEIFDNGTALERLYQKYPAMLKKLKSKYADSGSDAERGGESGRSGNVPEAYIQPAYPIVTGNFISGVLSKFGFSNFYEADIYCNIALLEQCGILNSYELELEQFYEIMQEMEGIENELNRYIRSNKDIKQQLLERKIIFYKEANDIYTILSDKLIRSEKVKASVKDNAKVNEWNFLLFVLQEKIAFYTQLMEEQEISGNRITNLQLLTEHIESLLLEKGEERTAALRQNYFAEYENNLKQQMDAAGMQLETLTRRVEAKVTEVGRKIDLLTSEIVELKAEEKKNIKNLEDKKAALKDEMGRKIALSILTGTLDLISIGFGIEQVFSGISSSIQSIADSSTANKESIESMNKIIALGNLGTDITLDIRLGNSFEEDRKEVLSTFTNDTVRNSGVDQVFAERVLDFQKNNVGDSDYGTKKERFMNGFTDQEKADADKVLKYLEKKEISVLEQQYKKSEQKKKLESLEKYQKKLEEQEKKLKNKKISEGINKTIGVANTTVKCIVNCIDTGKNYDAKIKEVEQAISTKENNIKVLDELNGKMTKFKEDTLKNKFLPFATNFSNVIGKQDVFASEVSKLDMRQILKTMKGYFEGTDFKAAGSVKTLFEEIQEILEIQLEITEKLDAKKDQLTMGKLIYDLTDDKGLEWTQRQEELKSKIVLNHIQYLSQVEAAAFRQFAFPFGGDVNKVLENSEIGILEDETDILMIIKMQNDKIQNWLKEGQYRWVTDDSYILKTLLKGNLNHEGKNEQGLFYGRYSCTQEECKTLLMGDEITFKLPEHPELDALKYVTIYANIQALRDRLQEKKIEVHLRFHGKGHYSFFNTLEDCYERYAFPQNEIEIVHDLDIMYGGGNTPDAIYSETEDKGLEKFKKAGMDSGRSPYSNVSISLYGSGKKQLNYNNLSEEQKAEFAICFPGTADIQWKAMYKKLKKLQCMNEKGVIIKSWSELQNAFQETFPAEFAMDQIKWMEGVIFSQLSLLGEEVPDLEIEFVGYGVHISRRLLEKQKDILQNYQSYKVD